MYWRSRKFHDNLTTVFTRFCFTDQQKRDRREFRLIQFQRMCSKTFLIEINENRGGQRKGTVVQRFKVTLKALIFYCIRRNSCCT